MAAAAATAAAAAAARDLISRTSVRRSSFEVFLPARVIEFTVFQFFFLICK